MGIENVIQRSLYSFSARFLCWGGMDNTCQFPCLTLLCLLVWRLCRLITSICFWGSWCLWLEIYLGLCPFSCWRRGRLGMISKPWSQPTVPFIKCYWNRWPRISVPGLNPGLLLAPVFLPVFRAQALLRSVLRSDMWMEATWLWAECSGHWV